MAQFAVLIYAGDSAHAPGATPADLEECDGHADELTEAGSMVMAYALTPREMATSVRGDAVTEGPFLDASHVVAGFYVLEASDLEAAVAIARTNPAVRQGGGVEVRPVHSGGPVSAGPVSGAPVSGAPVSGAPVSGGPVSAGPVSAGPGTPG